MSDLIYVTGDKVLESLRTEVEGFKKDKIKLDKELSDLREKRTTY